MTAGATKSSRGSRRFTGSRAQTGNSIGFRLESAFFKAAPEFGSAKSVRVDLIGPGKALLTVDVPNLKEDEGDPLLRAWLAFVEADMQDNPGHLVAIAQDQLSALESIAAKIAVSEDDIMPDGVTF